MAVKKIVKKASGRINVGWAAARKERDNTRNNRQ
jgi:hypothetical protein